MKLNEPIEQSMNLLSETVAVQIKGVASGEVEFNADEAFEFLMSVADLKRVIKEYENEVNEQFVVHMRERGEKVKEYLGHTVERKISSTRKNWEHETILEAVVNMSLSGQAGDVIDPQTGEVLDLTMVAKPIIDHVVKNLVAAAAIRDWRVTALRAMIPGLNPDDFCEVEKNERVSIRKK